MKVISTLLTTTAALFLGACASNPPNDYQPAPPQHQAAHASMHDQVHAAINDQMGSAGSDISVRVDGSKVYLSGHVGSQADHQRAHDIAHHVAGVTMVDHKALVVH